MTYGWRKQLHLMSTASTITNISRVSRSDLGIIQKARKHSLISNNLSWVMYPWFITLNANANEIVPLNTVINLSYKNHYFKSKYQGNCYFRHTLWPNLIKIVTLNANTKAIIT